MSFAKFGKFLPIITLNIFFSPTLSPLLWDSDDTNARSFVTVLRVPQALFFF